MTNINNDIIGTLFKWNILSNAATKLFTKIFYIHIFHMYKKFYYATHDEYTDKLIE